MTLFYILLGIIVIMFSSFLIGYTKYYEHEANQVLLMHKKKKLIRPFVLFISVLGFLTVVTLMINFIPLYRIPKLDINKTISSESLTNTTLPYNKDLYSLYDYEVTTNGNYLTSYSNGYMNCYYIYGPTCGINLDNIVSEISLYDHLDNEIWSIGGYDSIDRTMVFDNKKFDARAITFGDDQNIIAFGKYIDINTKSYGVGLLVIDPLGVITDIVELDLTDYNYSPQDAHEFFEIITTLDGGVTLKYSEIFQGSVLIHLDADLNDDWHFNFDGSLIGGVYSGIYNDAYMDTLLYEDGIHYVLIDHIYYAIDENGQLLWQKTSDHYITSFTIIDQKLYVIESFGDLLSQKNNIFSLKENGMSVHTSLVSQINLQTSLIEWQTPFTYNQRDIDGYPFIIISRNIIKDEQDNLLILAQEYDNIRRDLPYELFIIKLTSEGEYTGTEHIHGSYQTYQDIEDLRDVDYRLNPSYDNQSIILFDPLSNHRIISTKDMSFDIDLAITFNLESYNQMLELRVMINKLLGSVYAIYAIFFSVQVYLSLKKSRLDPSDLYTSDPY